MNDKIESSLSADYARRLTRLQRSGWKQVLDVQAPYRFNLQSLRPGFTLDVGCGVGRNLRNLGGHGVGVDPNTECVAQSRAAGFVAYTPDELPDLTFDTLLFAHVLEHVDQPTDLIRAYLPRLRSGGQVILITPQEAGYASDASHVRFLDFDGLGQIVAELGLVASRAYSFPFPRWAGRLFRYNEFVVVARRA